jgi:hypothetical protein
MAFQITSHPAPGSDDPASSAGGNAALVAFLVAALLMVGAVVAAAEIGQWWVLAPVMLVDAVATGLVIFAIYHLLGDDG